MKKRETQVCNYFYNNFNDIINDKVQFRINTYHCITFHPGIDITKELHRFWLNGKSEVDDIFDILYDYYVYFVN